MANNTSKKSISAALSLAALLAILFGLSQCKLPELNENSSFNTTNSYTSEDYSLISDSIISTEIESSNEDTSINSSSNSSTEIINPEEPAEVKQRNYTLNNLDVSHIRTLFNRIFTELPLISDIGFEYESDSIIKRYHLPGQLIDVEFELNIDGILTYIDNKSETSIELDFAQILTDYLKNKDAVLVGKNYKNNFGIIKNNNQWYFQFLGLYLPFETSIPESALIKVANKINIEGILFEKYAPETDDESRKNAIPLLFYKHFADILIENQLIDSATTLFNKAEADALTGQFDTNLLRSDLSVESSISSISNSSEFIIGEAIGTSYSTSKIDNYCLTSMFLEENKDFTSSENIYIQDNELVIYNQSDYEGVYNLNYGINDYFFPFANNFEIIAGQFDGIKYSNNPGKLIYANELGKIAVVGMYNSTTADYYIDDKSIEVNIDNYFFKWSLTDSYYFILDYLTQNAYLKSAKLLYANNYIKNLRSE